MPKKIIYALCCATLPIFAHSTQIDNTLQYLHFSHSKQKKEGMQYFLRISHIQNKNSYQLAWENSDIATFKPPLPTNLHVDKYFLAYSRKIAPSQTLQLHYAIINDNLAKETDNGKLYGLGYSYQNFMIKQYFTNYHHFNVYQTDLVYKGKKSLTPGSLHYIWIAKYIHIRQKSPNPFTRYAQNNYFTPGFKLHFQHNKRYIETGIFFSKRLFAVMNNGFSIQHHAMEFHRHYMFALGAQVRNWHLKAGYTYLKADEIPLQNKDVTLQSVMLSISYRF